MTVPGAVLQFRGSWERAQKPEGGSRYHIEKTHDSRGVGKLSNDPWLKQGVNEISSQGRRFRPASLDFQCYSGDSPHPALFRPSRTSGSNDNGRGEKGRRQKAKWITRDTNWCSDTSFPNR